MLFSRSVNFEFPPECKIRESSYSEEKKVMTILGVQVQSNLRWDSQVLQMVTRASKTIWVLRRMKLLGVDKHTLVEYWKSEGRVHLEMGCPVWHSSLTMAHGEVSGQVPKDSYGSNCWLLGPIAHRAASWARAWEAGFKARQALPAVRGGHRLQVSPSGHFHQGSH